MDLCNASAMLLFLLSECVVAQGLQVHDRKIYVEFELNREDNFLQTLLLLFKWANHRNKGP